MNSATIIGPDGEEPFPTGTKAALASRILDRATRILDGVRR
jgi:hypothetical protein